MNNTGPTTEPKKRKPQRKDKALGIHKVSIDGEEYIMECRPQGFIVRRKGKQHRDTKTVQEVIDFVIGQERLDLSKTTVQWKDPQPDHPESKYQDLLDACIELGACRKFDADRPNKIAVRLRMAQETLYGIINELAPGAIYKQYSEMLNIQSRKAP